MLIKSLQIRSLACACTLLILGSLPAVAEDMTSKSFESALEPFLDAYCIRCHGPEKQKGSRRFDQLKFPPPTVDDLYDFQDILDLLNLGEMPPIDEENQPSADERASIIAGLTDFVDGAYASLDPPEKETILRRLSHREYFNSISDLFEMDMRMFDPTGSFPGDLIVENLDNSGESLVTSGYLLDRYIQAADAIVEKALALPEKPQQQTWRFSGPFRQQKELDHRHRLAFQQKYLNLYENPNSAISFAAYGPLLDFEEGVPHGGYYRIRIKAEPMYQDHGYSSRDVPNDPEKPMVLRVVPGKRDFGQMHLIQPYEPELARFELVEKGPRWYELTTWLDAGFSPRFSYVNGTLNIRRTFTRVTNIEKAQQGDSLPESELNIDHMAFALKYGRVPHIRIHEVEITGPHFDTWPTRTWQKIVGPGPFNPSETRERLTRFATRAFRREVQAKEIDLLMSVVNSQQDLGKSPFEAFKSGLKAALCSPGFLYLDEPVQSESNPRLTDEALATRLSYFLWAGPPDRQLVELTESGRLSDPSVLLEQTERMLADPRSHRFITGFVDSWLTLRDLGEAPPDRRRFALYYEEDLGPYMRKETELFVRDALDQNHPPIQFLTADYSFINEPLSKLYRMPNVHGSEFRKVKFTDSRRGGLLGQASILKVTANGVDTSPVLRGVWILENIMGTPPSPPPPDVPPLDPDIRGAKTIRDQLTRHREQATCYECHRKMDPPGFALENFNAIGGWRNQYEEGGPVDASGVLPNGTSFDDVVGFKEAIARQETVFTRALASKLLGYALGRPVQPYDRATVDQLVTSLQESEGGFRDLVKMVVLSEAFART